MRCDCIATSSKVKGIYNIDYICYFTLSNIEFKLILIHSDTIDIISVINHFNDMIDIISVVNHFNDMIDIISVINHFNDIIDITSVINHFNDIIDISVINHFNDIIDISVINHWCWIYNILYNKTFMFSNSRKGILYYVE